MSKGVDAVLRAFPGSRLAWAGIHKPSCPGCGSCAATMLLIGDSRAMCARCQPPGLSRRPALEHRAKPDKRANSPPAAVGDRLPMD